ncbi:MAG: DUF1467 family protein [Beijerinckiaceae bacterium]|nr:DUF1467 family protein [Beijerinckiaceae bacterium]MCZ8299667.1 DUF1467 family protein [Beijerinckiaceae bacterium]
MSIGSGIAIYFVIWWTTLFAVLPLGVRSQVEAGEVVPGTEPGAPSSTNLRRIVLVNSGVAAVVFLIFTYILLPLL